MVGVGDEPTSPLTTTPLPVAPVTAELPRTPNAAAVPSGGATWAHAVEGTQRRANPTDRYAHAFTQHSEAPRFQMTGLARYLPWIVQYALKLYNMSS